jgi:phosphoglycolate phosphatase-like HAD superfamily hydrolase
MNYRQILFDLDGTITNPKSGIYNLLVLLKEINSSILLEAIWTVRCLRRLSRSSKISIRHLFLILSGSCTTSSHKEEGRQIVIIEEKK